MSAPAKHDPTEQVVGCLFLLALIPVDLAVSITVGGYVIATLWRWFIVPALGVAPLSFLAAAGLIFPISWLRARYPDTTPNNDSAFDTFVKSAKRTLFGVVYAAILLGEAWLFRTLFMR
jgi:hypothetical protein